MELWFRRSVLPIFSFIFVVNPVSASHAQDRSFHESNTGGWAQTQNNSTYLVDRLTDADPEGGGEGEGLAGDLRYTMSNAQSGDSITFSVTGEINLSRALPILTRDVSIQGAEGLTVNGGGSRIFFVYSGTRVLLSNLTITGGVGNGGGIFNRGVLTLDNVTISGNKAGDPTNGGGTGAGIWNYIDGTLTLNNSTVSGNSVLGNSSYNPGRGGGIANYGTLILNNSTVSGNSASEGAGGGISNTLNSSLLTLNSSTVTGNSATGVAGIGGGIDNHGTLTIGNTIIAGNTTSDLLGTLISNGHNLIGNTTGGDGFRPDLGDLLDVNPLLDSLKDNRGPTRTHALLAGSPAIDRGDIAACPQTDQRGDARPTDGDGDGSAICDIGSFEYAGPPQTSTSTPVPIDMLTLTPTLPPLFTDTPSPVLTLTASPVSTGTPTSTAEVTPTPPVPPCSGAIIPLLAVVILMVSPRRRIYR